MSDAMRASAKHLMHKGLQGASTLGGENAVSAEDSDAGSYKELDALLSSLPHEVATKVKEDASFLSKPSTQRLGPQIGCWYSAGF